MCVMSISMYYCFFALSNFIPKHQSLYNFQLISRKNAKNHPKSKLIIDQKSDKSSQYNSSWKKLILEGGGQGVSLNLVGEGRTENIWYNIDFALLLKLPFFILKTGTNFSIENQMIFTSIFFLSKIITSFSIENQVFVSIIFFWKPIQNFISNLQYILNLLFCFENQYKFFYWKSKDFCQHQILGTEIQ